MSTKQKSEEPPRDATQSINEPGEAAARDTSQDTPVSLNEPPGSQVIPPPEPPPEPELRDAQYDEDWEREDDDANEATGARKKRRK